MSLSFLLCKLLGGGGNPMLQECGVVGDWHKYPTWAWHTVGAEIRALLLIHYVTYAQELDSFLKVLIGISVAFH
jgi:hypothetical protein